MKRNYVCYDGVDGENCYFETEEEALKELKVVVENSLEDGEWIDGVEYSFVAKILHKTKKVKADPKELLDSVGDDEATLEDYADYYDMKIVEVE